MKKFRITDEDGSCYEVEEVVEDTKDEEIIEEKEEVKDDELTLTAEEIASLKELAKAAPSLLLLLEDKKEEVEEKEEDLDEEVDEEEEEIIDSEKVKTTKDSKKSYGSIEKKTQVVDSIEEDEISSAWAKRYGGK